MKKTQFAALAIGAAFFSAAGGVCQNVQAQPELHFRLIRDTVIVVSVMANNEGPFAFVLDTGADTTIVDPSLASRLSLVPLRHIQQTTIAGTQTVTAGLIATLAAGPAHVNSLPVLVQDLSELRNMDPQIEGIAGQDFLSHFNYLLDYRRRSLRFEEDNEIRSAMEGDPLPMEASGNRMIVAAEVRSPSSTKLRLLLDSGTNSVVLMRRASQALNLPAHVTRLEVTSSGHVGLQAGIIPALTVGSKQFHDVAVVLTDSEPAERVGDGLLPMALFQILYVSNREGFVIFNPRAKRN